MTQINFIRYELATGKIINTCSCPEYAYAANTPPSTEFGYINGAVNDPSAYYVLNETITERPSFNLPYTPIQIQANGIDSFNLSNLPQSTIVTIDLDDEAYTIDDGELSFATGIPRHLYAPH